MNKVEGALRSLFRIFFGDKIWGYSALFPFQLTRPRTVAMTWTINNKTENSSVLAAGESWFICNTLYIYKCCAHALSILAIYRPCFFRLKILRRPVGKRWKQGKQRQKKLIKSLFQSCRRLRLAAKNAILDFQLTTEPMLYHIQSRD